MTDPRGGDDRRGSNPPTERRSSGPGSPEPGRTGDDDRGGSFLNDFATSVLAVVAVGVLLFAVSGVWPPMVAIESPSMEPHIDTGDLVFVMEEHRFPGPRSVRDTGVVPV